MVQLNLQPDSTSTDTRNPGIVAFRDRKHIAKITSSELGRKACSTDFFAPLVRFNGQMPQSQNPRRISAVNLLWRAVCWLSCGPHAYASFPRSHMAWCMCGRQGSRTGKPSLNLEEHSQADGIQCGDEPRRRLSLMRTVV
jgi:hypothetical protein